MKIKIPSIYFFVISVIFLFGLFLRVVQLQTSPPGFNADEAALGYNAYSILQTGKDEWGTAFPLVFKSFSDYKPGLYVYLDIPFVWLFGLNELSARLPSILLGSLSIILIYLLSKEFFKKEIIALSTGFLLAISPWHIHYSRGAWETNVATFFILAGVFAFIKSFKNTKWLFLSSLLFIASMYTYQSPRVIVPGLILLLTIFYWNNIFIKKNIYIAIISAILLIPLMIILTSSAGVARFQGISVFSDIGPGVKNNQLIGEDKISGAPLTKFYHNKLTVYGSTFLTHYFDHFSPKFLFISGDPLGRNKIPEMGQLYIFEIITLFFGIGMVLKKRYENTKIILFWLILAPLASALTYQTPHATRAQNMVIPLTLISGLGLGLLIEKIYLLRKYFRYSLLALLIIVITFFVSFYLHLYYFHAPQQYALEWEYGFSKVVPFVFENKNKYQQIIISDKYDQAYILFLFYSKYDPATYQKIPKRIGDNNFGFSTIAAFDQFTFRSIGREDMQNIKNTLFVVTKEEIDDSQNYLKIINFPNGSPAFKIIGS